MLPEIRLVLLNYWNKVQCSMCQLPTSTHMVICFLTCHNGNKQFEPHTKPYIQKSKIYWGIVSSQNPHYLWLKTYGIIIRFVVRVDTISSNPVATEWAIPPDMNDGQNFLLVSCSWDKGCLAALQFSYPFSCLLFQCKGKSAWGPRA